MGIRGKYKWILTENDISAIFLMQIADSIKGIATFAGDKNDISVKNMT